MCVFAYVLYKEVKEDNCCDCPSGRTELGGQGGKEIFLFVA